MIHIQGNVYELIEENKNGFNLEAFKERYSDILGKFDYIVGDWGYGQLRLKGLFEDTNRKAPYDSRLSFLDEYLLEYCNFGCAYFLVKKNKELGQRETDQTKEENQGKPDEDAESPGKADDKYTKDGRDTRRRDRRRPRPRKKTKEPRETDTASQ